MPWRPTPENELIVARIFLGDCWIEREVKALKPGEVIRMFAPDGTAVHPATFEPDPDCVSVVVGYPRKNTPDNSPRDYGYGVPVDVYSDLDAVKAAGFA